MNLPITDTETLRSRILDRAQHMSRVPLLSPQATRFLEISRLSPDNVDVSELDGLITRDPALATRVLRVANSPYYAQLVKVSTVRKAILTIGLTDLCSLVLVTAMMDKFEGSKNLQGIDPQDFWIHSVGMSVAVKAAAALHPTGTLSGTEMSLAGLLHDIGRNVFLRSFPEGFDTCLRRVAENGAPLHEVEREVLGIDHNEVGAVLAEAWNLPEFIQQTIRFHHTPDEAEEAFRDIARLVGWCDRLVLREGIGASGNIPPEEGLEDASLALYRESEAQIVKTVRKNVEILGLDSDADSPDDTKPEHRSRKRRPGDYVPSNGRGGFRKSVARALRHLFGRTS